MNPQHRMQKLPDELKTNSRAQDPLVELLLAIADDKLMLGHRASDWTGLAPVLEEDIAFSAIAQEEIAHASALYEMVASLLDTNADAVAFGRKPDEYRCANLVTLSDEFDWARAIARQFFCDHLDIQRFDRLARSANAPLAALAGRIRAEETTHVEHADIWMIRLGGGGDESKQRMQAALDALAPEASMLFETTMGNETLEEAGIYPRGDEDRRSRIDMFDRWQADLQRVVSEVGLTLDVRRPSPDATGGRRGKHSDSFVALLDEMCEVYRIEPFAAW